MVSQELLSKFCKVTPNHYYKNKNNFEKILNSGNEMRPSEKKGKYKIISFADKHLRRMINMIMFKKRVKKYKIIDSVEIFNLSNIAKEFRNENINLFSSKIIFPWIAKAYLVNKVIDESDYGDTILWIDSDIVDIKENGIRNLFNLCNNSEKGVVGFHNDLWIERNFTKIDLFNYFEIDPEIYGSTTCGRGAIFLLRKNDFSISFFKKFLEVCSIERLMDYSPSKAKESDDFIIHQNDESILSLLYKINNIKTFPIPFHDLGPTGIIARHSGYFNKDVELPIIWHDVWHGKSYKELWDNCNKKFDRKISPDICMSISSDYFKNL